MKRLCDIGEDALIERMLEGFGSEGLAVGPGDDCAVVDPGKGRLRLLKADALVEDVHFLRETPARKVGWKAVARVLSDFAAMGGRPEFLLVTLAVEKDREVRWVEALYQGIRSCLEQHGGVLAGGETGSNPSGAVISVAGEGSVERRALALRSGGKPGDVLAVTGRLGGSLAGHHLDFHPRLKEGQWLGSRVSAMMDLSDGLAKDLPRLARSSGCGFELGELPRTRGCTVEQALGDGEDYELLVAVPKEDWEKVRSEWPEEFAPLSEIGRLTGQGGELSGGWDHFECSRSSKK